MASEDVQTNLRLPADLKDRLVASAAENNRSLSAEVASRLGASYASAEPQKVLQALEMLADSVELERSATYAAQRRAYILADALKYVLAGGVDLMANIKNHPSPDIASIEELMNETIEKYADREQKAWEILERLNEKNEARMNLGILGPNRP